MDARQLVSAWLLDRGHEDADDLGIEFIEYLGKHRYVIQALKPRTWRQPPVWDGTITLVQGVTINGIHYGPGTYGAKLSTDAGTAPE